LPLFLVTAIIEQGKARTTAHHEALGEAVEGIQVDAVIAASDHKTLYCVFELSDLHSAYFGELV
jgi:hypothetical protein